VHGMDAGAGLTTPNLVEAETNQALVETARRICVLADHTKWGTVGLSTIIPLSSVDLLVTDPELTPRARKALTDAGVEVVLATPATARTPRSQRSRP
jgi:DeoR/GlpR family transcriptional regulator of sugar metabolism